MFCSLKQGIITESFLIFIMSKILYPKLVKSYYKLISYNKIRFIIVGGGGFIVNYIGLATLYDLLKIPIVVSTILAAEVALLATFVGNNNWAFHYDHHHSLGNKLLRYHAGAAVGITINDLLVILLVHYAHIYYGLALVVGSATALIWNYTIYKRIVFKPSIDKAHISEGTDSK